MFNRATNHIYVLQTIVICDWFIFNTYTNENICCSEKLINGLILIDQQNTFLYLENKTWTYF